MQTFTYAPEGGHAATIYAPAPGDDLAPFWSFLARADAAGVRMGFDTETTGLDIYLSSARLRLVQLGSYDMREAWVLPAETGPRMAAAAREALTRYPAFAAHNAPFDAQVVDRHLGVRLETLMPRIRDSRIAAHLIDSHRSLKLKDLTGEHTDDILEAHFTELARQLGWPTRDKKAQGFARVAVDDPVYLTYSGADPLLATALDAYLQPDIDSLRLRPLLDFEHTLALCLAVMQRRGMRLDVPYTERLRDDLTAEADRWRARTHDIVDPLRADIIAALKVAERAARSRKTEAGKEAAARRAVERWEFGVGSPGDVAAALTVMGEHLTERTASGAAKVDREILLALADIDRDWNRIGAREPNALAEAVVRAKRADKWSTAYAEALLRLRDANDRIHPVIGGLMARTARMSISNPPLQQLPSSDWTIRRAFPADEGMLFGSIDFAAVEMRVLAALANVTNMRRAVESGEDLHDFTARLVKGDGFTKKDRKLLKGVGFGKIYGGGARTLSRQTGSDIDDVRRAIAEYDRVYPEIKTFSRWLQRVTGFGRDAVETPTGRRLPLDRDRSYAATNYIVQSTARDLLAQAIIDVHAAGMLDYVLLPVHDELLIQAPEAEASDVTREIGRLMNSTFRGVAIDSDPEVLGPTWGHGYGCVVKAGTCTTAGPHPHKFGVPHDGASQDV